MLGLNDRLQDLGVLEHDLPWLAKNALEVSKTLLSNHPLSYTEQEILAMYKKAF